MLHCKILSITYYEGVFVALGIQNAKRMRHIFICGLSGCNIFFNIFSYTARFFKKKSYLKKVLYFSLQLLSAPFLLILRRTERHTVQSKTYLSLHLKYPLFFFKFNENIIFSKDFRKILKHKFSWKSVQWEPRYSMLADERTDGDRQTDTKTWWS